MKTIPSKIGETRVLGLQRLGFQRFYTLIEKRENGECVIECSGSPGEYVPAGPVMIRAIRMGHSGQALIEYRKQIPIPYKPKTIIKRIEEFESLILIKN